MGIGYKDAGVDIDAATRAIELFRGAVESTHGPQVLGGIGPFAGLFRPDLAGYEDPVLAACTDSVGTKLKVAIAAQRHDTVGIDLVAMSVNDLLTVGAEPLFFLDCFSCGKLDPDVASAVVRGVAEGCRQAGCALLGGEIAEMPGIYSLGDYDLVGFAVGIVDQTKMLGPHRVQPDDVLIGLPSSGLHSNGYSLARKIIFDMAGLALTDELPGCGRSVADELLEPTRIYTREVEALLATGGLHALAHVTGGGFFDNVSRALPEDLGAEIDVGVRGQGSGVRDQGKRSYPTSDIRHLTSDIPHVISPIFRFLMDRGGIAEGEMARTFNLGIGMVAVVAQSVVERALEVLAAVSCPARVIGSVHPPNARSERIGVLFGPKTR